MFLRGMVFVLLVILSFWDFKYKKIPVLLPLGGGLVCLLFRIFSGKEIFEFLITAGIIFLLFFLVGKVTRGQIGTGDAFVFLMIGAELGCVKSLWLMYLSFLFAFFAAVFFLLIRKKGKGYEIPLVPFICLAYAVLFSFEQTGLV